MSRFWPKPSFQNFYKAYFDTTYFLLCSPDHFQLDKSGDLIVKKWLPHRFLTAVLTLLSLYWIFHEIQTTHAGPKDSPKDPTVLFEKLMNLINTFWLTYNVKQFWIDSKVFSNILKQIKSQKLESFHGWIWNRYVGTGIALLYVYLGLSENFVGSSIPSQHLLSWTTANGTSIDGPIELGIDVILKVGWLHRRIFGAFAEAHIFIITLLLWGITRHFIFILDADHGMDGLKVPSSNGSLAEKELYDKYKGVKNVSELMNSALGTNVTCFLSIVILDYAIGLDQIFIENSIRSKAQPMLMMIYFLLRCTILFFAVEICRQMKIFKNWLHDERNRINFPAEQIPFIINDLDNNVIAVKGSSVFPITYGMVANMVGITITYFILCVQG